MKKSTPSSLEETKKIERSAEEAGFFDKKISRRQALKMTAVTGAGIAIAASGLPATIDLAKNLLSNEETDSPQKTIPFYGKHQAGIITDQQSYGYLVAFDLTVTTRDELKELLQKWTLFVTSAVKGQQVKNSTNQFVPPKDTGDSIDLGAQNLTVTIGYGPSFFEKNGQDRFDIKQKRPLYLEAVPAMAHDAIVTDHSDGDLVFQVCSDDQQVAFHCIRNLIRLASSQANVRFLEGGFLRGPKKETARNLFGFKDGTANSEHATTKGYKDVVWAGSDEPNWFKDGSYLGYRKIQMFLEVWDRSSLEEQEQTFGRKKDSGAPFGQKNEFDPVKMHKQPLDSHVKLVKDTKQQLHRRAYSYQHGIDERTGNINAGLLFLAFCKNPAKQYLPMLSRLGQKDKLNEYTVPIANGLYACQKGLATGEYFGQTLLENQRP